MRVYNPPHYNLAWLHPLRQGNFTSSISLRLHFNVQCIRVGRRHDGQGDSGLAVVRKAESVSAQVLPRLRLSANDLIVLVADN